MKKIKIQVIGNGKGIVKSACGGCSKTKESSCSGCDGCNNLSQCKSCDGKKTHNVITVLDGFIDLQLSFNQCPYREYVELEFIDITSNKFEEFHEVKRLIKEGYEAPFVVIDGIVRFYGGISYKLIYNDVKELFN